MWVFGRGGCCSIRPVEGTQAGGRGRGGELTPGQEGESATLEDKSEESARAKYLGGVKYVPSSIPSPDLKIGTSVMLEGEIVSTVY